MGRKEKKRAKEAASTSAAVPPIPAGEPSILAAEPSISAAEPPMSAAEPPNPNAEATAPYASPLHNPEDDKWIDAMEDDEAISLTAGELRRLIAEKFEAGKREVMRRSMDAAIEEYVPANVDGSPPPTVAYVAQSLPSQELEQFREQEAEIELDEDKKSEEDSNGESQGDSAEGNGGVSTISGDIPTDPDLVVQTNAMAALSVSEHSSNDVADVDRSKGAIPKQRPPELPPPVDEDTLELHINEDDAIIDSAPIVPMNIDATRRATVRTDRIMRSPHMHMQMGTYEPVPVMRPCVVLLEQMPLHPPLRRHQVHAMMAWEKSAQIAQQPSRTAINSNINNAQFLESEGAVGGMAPQANQAVEMPVESAAISTASATALPTAGVNVAVAKPCPKSKKPASASPAVQQLQAHGEGTVARRKKNRGVVCYLCEGRHPSNQCPDWAKMSLDKRLALIEATNRCVACLRPPSAHENGQCEARECRECPGLRHNAWLCPVMEMKKQEERRATSSNHGQVAQVRPIRVVSPRRVHRDTPRPKPMRQRRQQSKHRRHFGNERRRERSPSPRHDSRGRYYDNRRSTHHRREEERNSSQERRDRDRRERSDSRRSYRSRR